MKKVGFGVLFLLFTHFPIHAADVPKAKPTGSAPSKKSQYNTQVYEKSSDEESSFDAVVKVVREVQGETEVFFVGKSGFYSLKTDNGQSYLVESQKKQIPVHVIIDADSRTILKVTPALNSAGNSSGN